MFHVALCEDALFKEGSSIGNLGEEFLVLSISESEMATMMSRR